METEVKGHMSHRKGKRFYVRPHKMHVNERVHERHEHRLEEEAEALEHELHKHRRHLEEHMKRHRKLVKV